MRAPAIFTLVGGGVLAAGALLASTHTSAGPTSNLQDVVLPDSNFDDSGIADSGLPDVITSCTASYGLVCSEAGAPGCAGFGGAFGTGAQGGGAAIPLYVIGNSHVTMNNGAFFVARGGQGGVGGMGGPGGNGDAGRTGSSDTCFSSCDTSCKQSGGFTLNGGAGGVGGNGGTGGNGGGGNGGPIYFYAYVDAAAPTIVGPVLDASFVIDGGGPGPGSPPNGQPGASGISNP